MISQQVREISETLVRTNASVVGDATEYLLDGSWPSIGIIDRALFWLNGRDHLLPKEEGVVRAVACYFAEIAHELWQSFSGEVTADIDTSGVYLKLSKSPYNNGKDLRINLEKELRRIVTSRTPEIPIIDSFDRVVGFNHNRLSLFLIGVFLGRSPVMDGVWPSGEDEDGKSITEKIVSKLANSCAAHYRSRFPDEPLGAIKDLYIEGKLIFPPTLKEEKFVAEDSVQSLIDYLIKINVPIQQGLELFANLSTFADERISITGLACSVAFANEIPEKVVQLGEQLSMFSPLLRRAVTIARSKLNMEPADWLFADSLQEGARLSFKNERVVGFFPFLKLSSAYIAKNFKNPEIKEIVSTICAQQIQEAKHKIIKITEADPKLVDLRAQLLWLNSLTGAYEKIEKDVRKLLSEPDAEAVAEIYELGGRCCSMTGKLEQALAYFRRAYGTSSPTKDEFAQHSLSYAQSLCSVGRHQEAQRILIDQKETGERPGAYWALRITLARQLNLSDELDRCSYVLREVAPYHPGIMREIWFPHIRPDLS